MKTTLSLIFLSISNLLLTIYCFICVNSKIEHESECTRRIAEINFHWLDGCIDINKKESAESIDFISKYIKVIQADTRYIADEIAFTQQMINREIYVDHLKEKLGVK